MANVQLARAAAEKLVERLGVTAPPVEVKEIASALDLRIVLDDLGSDVSGLLVARNQTACIAVKRTDPAVRQRFTIAHEIGHFVLGHHLHKDRFVHADQHHQVVYRSQSASEGLDPLEIQANQFAASLLMPAKLVREQIAGIRRQQQDPAPLQENDVSRLAREFRVSEQAMTIRLTTLGLL